MRLLTPTVVLSDVMLGNADWAGNQPMGRAKEVTFDVRLPTLLSDEIVVPHLRLTGATVDFLRDEGGRANWRFRESEEPGPRNVRVLTLGLDDARVTYRDAVNRLLADLHGYSRKEGRYETRIAFRGKWREAPFEGTADTGSVLSLRGSSEPFPMRIVGTAGATEIRAEGEVADITRFRHIDADVEISGPSLASLHQTLKIALPDTPPYRARGRLKRDGDSYAYGDFKGAIGSTDVAGSAKYELRKPRPMLTAELRSQALAVADLGPLIGVKPGTAATGGKGSPARPAAAGVRATGKGAGAPAGQAGTKDGVLPDAPFNLDKLNSMDADVRLSATRLRFPGQIPLQDFGMHARLQEGVLTLQPLNFGFAGGNVVAKIVMDASRKPLVGALSADFKRVQLKQLFPALDKLRESAGALGAQVRLEGRGDSVAALLGSANGTATAGMAGGRVSELAVWLVNLNGGELIPLLFGGDRPTPIRCAAAALEVKSGVGRISTFVFDTEESRIEASGSVDFRNESIDFTLRPEAKKLGVLSLRGPVRIQGSFRDVDYSVAPQSIARGLGAIALGLINPVLALLPLVETGQGEDTNCRAILEPVRGAVRQSGRSETDAPAAGEKSRDGNNAPIIQVPPGDATMGAERQPRAPIVEVPAKK